MMSVKAEKIAERVWLKGRLQYATDQNGLGETVGYYESGSLRFRYPLRNGTINGIGKMWYENGAIQCEESFRDGVLHGPAYYWYSNGMKGIEAHYRKGKRHGFQKDWYPTGILKAHRTFASNEVLHGPCTEWHPNGNLKSEMNFLEGRRHGLHKFYDENGTLIRKEGYVRGVSIPAEKYEKLLAGQLSAKDILAIRNSEVRRIFVEEFGYARILAEMPHEVIDRDGQQELVRIAWSTREEPICLVKVKCPSTGAFYTLRVPPGRVTVKSAVAWTFDVKADEYDPIKET